MAPGADAARRPGVAIVLAAAAWVAPAQANVPFYFVASSLKFHAMWTIAATLLTEAWALRRLFGLDVRGAAVASLVANGASAAIGWFAYVPFLAALQAAYVSSGFRGAPGSEAALSMLALLVVVTAVDVAVELAALRVVRGLRPTGRTSAGFALVNLLTVGLCVGALAWDAYAQPRADPDGLARVERHYAAEIAWMRAELGDWPAHVRRDGPSGRLETEPAHAAERAARARAMRFEGLAFRGPAGDQWPVMIDADAHRWRTVARTVRDDVEVERRESSGGPAAVRHVYRITATRPDGTWQVEATFADPDRDRTR
jgi:hypothetical protein